MANLTITVDEATLKRARLRAVQRDESVNAHLAEALRRYADGYARLVRTTHEACTLCVVHDVTIRMMVNAVAGDDPIDGRVTRIENATPYRFTADELADGLARMYARAGDAPTAPPVPPMR